MGCNFLPGTAVNDVEMWQAESYDEACIARELSYAKALGIRINLRSKVAGRQVSE